MAETFCPECGTVFESTGSVCPNCAANVGNASYKPAGNKESGLSVMPLAKSSGERKGFAAMDGDSLQLRDREHVVREGVEQEDPRAAMPSSGLDTDSGDRPDRSKALPDLPPPRPVAAAEEEVDQGGWMKPALVVIIVIGLAMGGKVVMDAMKDKKTAEEPQADLQLDG